MTYAQWVALVKQEGGTATTIPANVPDDFQQWVGYPAARYSGTMYATLANAGQIDANAPTVASNSGSYVYVVAPQDVWTTAPHTMTTAESIANTVYSYEDQAANAVGLGALGDFAKDLGKQILIGAGVALGVAILLKRSK
jgi:hypothetical protein